MEKMGACFKLHKKKSIKQLIRDNQIIQKAPLITQDKLREQFYVFYKTFFLCFIQVYIYFSCLGECSGWKTITKLSSLGELIL